MKLLLINPPQCYNIGENPFIVFPLGLGYIAAILKQNNFNLEILDCIGEGYNIKTQYQDDKYLLGLRFNQIEERVRKINPDVILISCFFSLQFSIVLRIAAIIKTIKKNIKVITGGNHVSAIPEEVLLNKNIDFIVIGEGEIPLLKLIKHLTKKGNELNIKGIGYKKTNKIIINKELDLVQDIDKLPFPTRDLFFFENYLNSNYKHSLLYSKGKIAEMITSRGCPFNCTYCASHLISGKRWRPRSVNNVMKEIFYLKEKYNVTEIHFVDDNISLNKKRFEYLCKAIINSNLRIKWTIPNGIYINNLDKNLLYLMKKSGCYALFLPIESNNPKILKKHVKKGISESHIKYVIDYAKKLRFYLVGFFLMGFYEETRGDIKKDIKFAANLGIDEAHFSIITPLPGSTYYLKYIRSSSKYDDFSSKKANFNTHYLHKKEIERLRDLAYLYFEINKFFKRPISYFNLNQIKRLFRYLRYLIANFLMLQKHLNIK